MRQINLKKELTIVSLIGLITISFFCIWNIIDSIRTIDTIYNFMNVAIDLGIDTERLTDIGNDFKERPLTDYYVGAMNNLKIYILFLLFLCMCIGYLLSELK